MHTERPQAKPPTRIPAVPARAVQTRRRAGWTAAIYAVTWWATLAVEHLFGLFPDQTTGGPVIATQLLFFAGMLGWAAALMLLLGGHLVTGRFAVAAASLQAAGLFGLVTMGLLTLGTGRQDSPVFAIAGLSMILGGVLTGIALYTGNALPGRSRYVGLAYSTAMAAFLLLGTPPTLLSESMLPLAWLVLGLTLLAVTRQADSGR